jgi:hypothetical protein
MKQDGAGNKILGGSIAAAFTAVLSIVRTKFSILFSIVASEWYLQIALAVVFCIGYVRAFQSLALFSVPFLFLVIPLATDTCSRFCLPS